MSAPLFSKSILAKFTEHRRIMRDPAHVDPDSILAKVSCGKDIFVVVPSDLLRHEGCWVRVTFEFVDKV